MSIIKRNKAKSKQFELEHTLAPAVEEQWAEDFIVELRLLGVVGNQIGEALTEVNSHCQESGKTAAEIFGDPVVYARELNLDDNSSISSIIPVVLPVATQVVGMLLVLQSYSPWRLEEPTIFSWGTLITYIGAASLTGLLIAFSSQMLRTIIKYPLISIILFLAMFGCFICVGIIWSGTAVSLNSAWLFPLGIGLLLGGTIWGVVINASTQDPINAPDSINAPATHDAVSLPKSPTQANSTPKSWRSVLSPTHFTILLFTVAALIAKTLI